MIFTALTCVCADIFDNDRIVPGGEALNYACAVKDAAPEIFVYLIGAVGRDKAGEAIRRAAALHGVGLENLHTLDGKTASNRTYLTDGGDRYYKENSWDGGVYQTYALCESDRELLGRSDLVHTSINCPSFHEILELKKSGSFLLSVDFNDRREFSEWEGFLGGADFFFISAGGDPRYSEICLWAKEQSRRFSGIFTVTLGADGSRAYVGGREYAAKAERAEKVVDTTGCGDSYQAGFTAEYMKTGDAELAVKAGASAAARVIGVLGGTGGIGNG